MLWMPGVHKFPELKDQSFYSLSEIACAAGSRTGGMWSEWDILRNFIHVTRMGIRDRIEGEKPVSSLELRNEYGQTATISSDNEDAWLEAKLTTRPTPYVPAGWGVKVLEALERGAMKVELMPVGNKILEVGVKATEDKFPLYKK